MQYKLINLESNQEFICEKVILDGYEYYVSDSEKILNGDFCIHPTTLNISQHNFENNLRIYWKKIIATDNPSLELPKIVDEVEEMINRLDTPENLDQFSFDEGYKQGYNKAKEQYTNTKQDMIEFAEWKEKNEFSYSEKYNEWTSSLLFYSGCAYTTEQLLELFEQSRPKTIYFK